MKCNFVFRRTLKRSLPLTIAQSTIRALSTTIESHAQTCLLFPGQGSQYVGMGKDLFANFRPAKLVFEEVDEALKTNLSKIMFDGELKQLSQTKYAQPAILANSIAVWRILQAEADLVLNDTSHIKLAMGHSLGEYSAITAAESLTLAEAVKLVHFRGKAMQKAADSRRQPIAMAALMPIGEVDAREVSEKAEKETELCCDVANINSDKQIVISGDRKAVERAIDLAKKEKRVRKTVLLEVSAPFHSKIMSAAAEELRQKLSQVQFSRPRVPVVSNVTGDEISDPALFAQLLEDQVVATVQWNRCMAFSMQKGVSNYLELGPGKVLSSLVKSKNRDARCITLGDSTGLRDYLRNLG